MVIPFPGDKAKNRHFGPFSVFSQGDARKWFVVGVHGSQALPLLKYHHQILAGLDRLFPY
jgi:hypothetical protein